MNTYVYDVTLDDLLNRAPATHEQIVDTGLEYATTFGYGWYLYTDQQRNTYAFEPLENAEQYYMLRMYIEYNMYITGQ